MPFLRSNKIQTRQGVPIVEGSLPVFGHLFHLSGDAPVFFEEAVQKYGPIFFMKLSEWTLFASGTEAFDALRNKTTTSRHYHRVAGKFTGHSLLGVDGAPHRRMRGAMNGPFTPRGITVSGAAAISSETIEERVAKLSSESIDIHAETQALALQIVFRIMGIPTSDLAAWTEKYQRYLLNIFPLKLDVPFSPARRAREASAWLDDRYRAIMSSASKLDAQGTIATLLAARDDEGRGLTERELIDNLKLLALAGHETTATTMAWIVLELALNPAHFDALVDESIAAPHVPCSPEELKRHPFAEALFRESVRKYPPVANVSREVIEPMRVHGFDAKPGDVIGVPLCLFGRDRELYPDPDAFKPSRFLDRKVQISSIETAAFGGGPHFCLGYHFAHLETMQFAVAFAREMHARGVRPRLAEGVKLERRYRPFAQPLKNSRVVLEPVKARPSVGGAARARATTDA